MGVCFVRVQTERLMRDNRSGGYRGRKRKLPVKLFLVFCGGKWLFCKLLHTEGYLSPPAVLPSCHMLLCAALSWHPGTPTPSAHHYLPVCILHICQPLCLLIISMEQSRFRLFMQHKPIWESLHGLSPFSKQLTFIDRQLQSYCPLLFSLLINQVILHMIRVLYSRQFWNFPVEAVPSLDTRPICLPHCVSQHPTPPGKSLNYPEPITANSHFAANHLWLGLWEALATERSCGGERPKPWAGQPTID